MNRQNWLLDEQGEPREPDRYISMGLVKREHAHWGPHDVTDKHQCMITGMHFHMPDDTPDVFHRPPTNSHWRWDNECYTVASMDGEMILCLEHTRQFMSESTDDGETNDVPMQVQWDGAAPLFSLGPLGTHVRYPDGICKVIVSGNMKDCSWDAHYGPTDEFVNKMVVMDDFEGLKPIGATGMFGVPLDTPDDVVEFLNEMFSTEAEQRILRNAMGMMIWGGLTKNSGLIVDDVAEPPKNLERIAREAIEQWELKKQQARERKEHPLHIVEGIEPYEISVLAEEPDPSIGTYPVHIVGGEIGDHTDESPLDRWNKTEMEQRQKEILQRPERPLQELFEDLFDRIVFGWNSLIKKLRGPDDPDDYTKAN